MDTTCSARTHQSINSWRICGVPQAFLQAAARRRHCHAHRCENMAFEEMAGEAQAIEQERSGSAPDRNTTTRLLQDSVQGLGSGAQLSLSGSQAVIRMEGVAPQVLARSLDQWRRVARVVPTGADLRWQGSGWSGTVTLAGPGLGE